jgi:hypothetical protein
LRDVWRQIRTSFNAGAALCLATLPDYALRGDFNPLIQLISVIVAAGLAYLTALWVVEKTTFLKMLEMAGTDKSTRVAGKSTRNWNAGIVAAHGEALITGWTSMALA